VHVKVNFLLISGVEYHINDFTTKRAWHIVGLNMNNDIGFDKSLSAQDIINGINSSCGMAILAHPGWSLLTHEDVLSLDGLFGVEIWNSFSHHYSARGLYTGFTGVLASKRMIPRIFAVDDTHWYRNELFDGYVLAVLYRILVHNINHIMQSS